MNAAKIQQVFVAMYDQFSERREDHPAAPDFPAGRVDFVLVIRVVRKRREIRFEFEKVT